MYYTILLPLLLYLTTAWTACTSTTINTNITLHCKRYFPLPSHINNHKNPAPKSVFFTQGSTPLTGFHPVCPPALGEGAQLQYYCLQFPTRVPTCAGRGCSAAALLPPVPNPCAHLRWERVLSRAASARSICINRSTKAPSPKNIFSTYCAPSIDQTSFATENTNRGSQIIPEYRANTSQQTRTHDRREQ